ncbi:MAG: hypothetical protein QXL94_00825 [Candidatus Parvarchaeum sp.]
MTVKKLFTSTDVDDPIFTSIRNIAWKHPDIFLSKSKIINKDGILVDFKLNYTQREYMKIYNYHQKNHNNKRLGLYILKSRQVGSSTFAMYLVTLRAWARNNHRVLLIAPEKERGESLLERPRLFLDNLPMKLKINLTKDSSSKIQFDKTNAMISVFSLGDKTKEGNTTRLRGDTIHDSVFTEFAYINKPLEIIQQINILSSKTELSMSILETTPKGYGTEAHDFWKESKKNKTGYIPIFVAWHKDPECRIAVGAKENRDYTWDEIFKTQPNFKEYVQKENISLPHAKWGFEMYKENCKYDWELFLQEYPFDDESAWLNRSTTFFDIVMIKEYETYLKTLNMPSLSYELDNIQYNEIPSLNQLRTNRKIEYDYDASVLTIWEKYVNGHKYVIGADVAGGKNSSDFSAAYVVDCDTLNMVAEVHARIAPHEFASILVMLSRMYNNCTIAPERNNQIGLACLLELKRLNANIFQKRIMDKTIDSVSDKYGWFTDEQNRETILAGLNKLFLEIRDEKIVSNYFCRSWKVLKEMYTFIRSDNAKQKPEAIKGKKDDCIMAFAIAHAVASLERNETRHNMVQEMYDENTPDIIKIGNHMRQAKLSGDPAKIIQKVQRYVSKTNWRPKNG